MLFHMLHTRKPVKTNPSTNFKHHFQRWCNQKLNPLVQKSETRKRNQFSKETVFFFTFCSSFLLFVFIYIFIFFYIFSVGLYTICNRKCESDHAQMLYFLLMRSAFCCGVLLTTCSQTSNSIAVSHFPFPVPHSPFLLLVTSRAIKSNAFTKNRTIVSPRPCKWKMEMS